MLRCDDIRTDLSAYLDRELPTWKHQLIRWHLFRCTECARETALLQQTDILLKRAPGAHTDERFVDRVLFEAGIMARREDQSLWHRAWRHGLARLSWCRFGLRQKAAIYAGIVCILIGLGVTAPRWHAPEPPVHPSETQVVQVEFLGLLGDDAAQGYTRP